MLMSLGTLATIIESGVDNLVLFVAVNGTFEITGNQPIAAAPTIDFAAMARAAGFARVFDFDDRARYEARLDDILSAAGPTFVSARCERGSEGPISRTAQEASRYLQVSLAEWSERMRAVLTEDS
jgi:sulfopyruvate decarboxylase subunit beta